MTSWLGTCLRAILALLFNSFFANSKWIYAFHTSICSSVMSSSCICLSSKSSILIVSKLQMHEGQDPVPNTPRPLQMIHLYVKLIYCMYCCNIYDNNYNWLCITFYTFKRVLATACTTASKTLPCYLSSCNLRLPLASTGIVSIEGSDGGIRVYSTLQQETCKGGSLGIYSMLHILDGNAALLFAIASVGGWCAALTTSTWTKLSC